MIDTTLPIHAVTGVQAVGWRKARRDETGPQPIWPILGGAEEDDTEDKTDAESTEDAAADQGDDSADTDDAEKSDDEDWKAKFEAQQRIARKLERRTKADARKIAELEGVKPNGDKPAANTDDKPDVDVDKIRAEARAEVAREALKERVSDKIEAKAKDFADPEDAVSMLLRQHDVDDFIDDGKVDVEAIQDALKELLEKKPYLAASAQGGKQQRFQGSADIGAKPNKPSRPKSLEEAVRRRFTPQ